MVGNRYYNLFPCKINANQSITRESTIFLQNTASKKMLRVPNFYSSHKVFWLDVQGQTQVEHMLGNLSDALHWKSREKQVIRLIIVKQFSLTALLFYWIIKKIIDGIFDMSDIKDTNEVLLNKSTKLMQQKSNVNNQ